MTFRLQHFVLPLCSVLPLAALGCGDSKSDGDAPGAQAGSTSGGTGAGTGGSRAGAGGSSAAGSAGTGQGGGGTSSGGTGGEEPGAPLLERPAEISYDCEATRPMAMLGINPWGGGGLHAQQAATYLARLQGAAPGPGGGAMKVTWSTLGATGTLGSAQSIPLVGDGYLGQLTTARAADTFALLWVESGGNDSQLAMAAIGASGDLELPRQLVSSGAGQRNYPIISSQGDGYGIVWAKQGQPTQTLEFQRVSADGVKAGGVVPVTEGGGLLQPSELVAHGDGFVLFYSRIDYSADVQGTFYVVLAADGTPQGEPVKLGGGFGATSTTKRGDDLLVAWSDQSGGYETSDISRTIRIGVIGANGQRNGPAYALQSPKVDEENVDPRWVDMGDDVGLFWSQGSVIYICAGCFPDNELRFVVLGGDDLVRKSEVLELPSPDQHGLRSPHAVRMGEDILAIASVTRHVDAEGASATIRCTP